jgi:hypothetical protein
LESLRKKWPASGHWLLHSQVVLKTLV